MGDVIDYCSANIYYLLPSPLLQFTSLSLTLGTATGNVWQMESEQTWHERGTKCFPDWHLSCLYALPLPWKEYAMFPNWDTGGGDLKSTCSLKQSHPGNPKLLEREKKCFSLQAFEVQVLLLLLLSIAILKSY